MMEFNIEMRKVVEPDLPDVVPDSESAVQVKATLDVACREPQQSWIPHHSLYVNILCISQNY